MSFSDSFTEINAIAARVSKHADPEAVESLRARAVATGMSLDTFRASALALMPHVSPVREYKPLDIPPNEWDQYSISKAIMSQLPGSNVDAGREREFSQEIKRQHRGVANQ